MQTDTSQLLLEVEADEIPRPFDMVIENELITTFELPAKETHVAFNNLPKGNKIVEIWLPQQARVSIRQLMIDDNANAISLAENRLKWVTYGSSITQCASAYSPARTWPAIVARKHDLNLTSLGFGGQCHLDVMIARLIRDLPADVITLGLGINVYGAGSLNLRTFKSSVIGMIKIIREKHPKTPIGAISSIVCMPRETTPNAAGMTLEIMREEIKDAVERLKEKGDENIYYFNGLELFGPELADAHLPDELHPDGHGYEILGSNFSQKVMRVII